MTLRQMREALNLSQQQMARRFGVSRQRWCDLEVGVRLPSCELARQLEAALPPEPCPCVGDTLTFAQQRQLVSPRRYEISPVNVEKWLKAKESWAYPISQLQLGPRMRQWMESTFHLDSSVEAYGWYQLATLKARPLLHNPHELGFRAHPIVDNLGRALGERRLPGLYGQHDGLHFLVWPQVNLRPPNSPTLRPDGLVWLRKGRKCAWSILEFDGRGHNADNDAYRDSVLRLPPIRFDEDQHIRTLQVARRFIAQSYEKLGLPLSPPPKRV